MAKHRFRLSRRTRLFAVAATSLTAAGVVAGSGVMSGGGAIAATTSRASTQVSTVPVPAGSTLIDSLTTSTSQTYQNGDGSRTVRLSARPVRAKSADGVWRPIDTTLLSHGTHSWVMANGSHQQTISDEAGPTLTVVSDQGPIVFSHPDAVTTRASVSGSTATFPAALTGGRAVSMTMRPDGFEESIILPNTVAASSYIDAISLPAGLTARQGTGQIGVEFIDAAGAVVATFGGGVAYVARPSATGPEMVNVETWLTSTNGSTVTVTNAIADPSWLATAGTGPVTVDPTFTWTTGSAGGQDTYVNSDNCTGVYYTQSTNLRVGSPQVDQEVNCGSYSGGGSYSAGYSRTRTFLYFPLNLPTDANYQVTSATLTMTVRQSCANLTSCTPSGYIYAGGLATSWNQASVDWANQPTPDTYAYADDKYVVYAGQGVGFNVASLAQRWMTGKEANHGLELIAVGAEHSLNAFQNYYPSESGYSVPTLVISFYAKCSSATGEQAGHISDGQSKAFALEGVESNVRLEGGYILCTGDTNPGVNFSTSWVMIHGGGGWVQVGTMYRYGYSCPVYWAQDKANTTSGFKDWYGGCAPQDGSTHSFQVKSYYTGSNWVFQSYVDNSNLIHQSTFGIINWAGSTVDAQYDGETYHPESNIPGSPGSPQYYSLMYVQNYSNDNWYDVCGNVGLQQVLYSGVAPYWGVSAPTCDTSSYWSKTN